MRKIILAGVLASVAFTASAQDAASLTGTVSYRERMALDPGAEVTVTLIDSSAGGKSLATRTFKTDGKQIPIPFRLPYTLGDIRREGYYGLSAKITAAGTVLFESAEPLPVLTQGQPARDLVLVLRRAGS